MLAFSAGRRPACLVDAAAPSPSVVGGVAFGVFGVYWIEAVFLPELLPEWVSVGWWFVPVAVIVALCLRRS